MSFLIMLFISFIVCFPFPGFASKPENSIDNFFDSSETIFLSQQSENLLSYDKSRTISKDSSSIKNSEENLQQLNKFYNKNEKRREKVNIVFEDFKKEIKIFEKKINFEKLSFDEEILIKSIRQENIIDEYIKNPAATLNAYEEKIYRELKNEKDFLKASEYFKVFQSFFSETETTNFVNSYNSFEKNEKKYFCALTINYLLKRIPFQGLSENSAYFNTLRGFSFAFLLDIRFNDSHILNHSNRIESWDIFSTFSETTYQILSNFNSNQIEESIKNLIVNFKNKYNFFEKVPVVFLYGKNAVFTPRALNYARSKNPPMELMGLCPTVIHLHLMDHHPIQMIVHDYNHYHDTIYLYLSNLEKENSINIEKNLHNFQNIQKTLYELIEGNESTLAPSEKQLAHYIFMYSVRDLMLDGKKFYKILKCNENVENYLHALSKSVDTSHRVVMKDIIHKTSNWNCYHNSYLDIMKLFPNIKRHLENNIQKCFMEHEYNIFSTFAAHSVIFNWFIKKALFPIIPYWMKKGEMIK